MNEFVNFDHDIKYVSYAMYVKSGTGKLVTTDRPFHGLALYLDDAYEVTFDGKNYIPISYGDIIYYPKHSNYKTKKHFESKGIYAVNFDYHTTVSFEPMVLKTKNTEKYLFHFKELDKIHKKRPVGYKKLYKSELYKIFALLEYEYNLQYTPQDAFIALHPAIDYILSNYTNEIINIDKLATLCKMSPTNFRYLFKMKHGVSPKQYVTQLKMSYAKELLLSNATVESIADEFGYCDTAAFSKAFKKHTGLSPLEYKRQSGDNSQF